MKTLKKALKIVMIMFIILIFSIGGVMVYLKTALPDVDEAKDITIEGTPEQIARGEYLANCVAVCMDCHSTRDWSKFSGPLVEGTLGKGGEKFGREFGFPGEYYARNITPAGIGDWTDGEVLRAVTCGIDKKDRPFFPIMPYRNYGKMDMEDITAIIAYIRTLAPIVNEVPEAESDFPMNFIINTMPQNAQFSKRPDKTDKVAYGEYMITMSGCFECHTQQDKGTPVAGMEYAGGFKFDMGPMGVAYSANITPDKATGIGYWTEEAFVKRFKSYQGEQPVIKAGEEQQSPMPWTMYADMDEYDLQAIFAYLQTVKPIENKVNVFEKAL